MQLEGRAAIADRTGGLGGATVRWLAAQGVGVVVLDPDGARAAAPGAELGGRASAVVGDSNDDEAVSAAVSAAGASVCSPSPPVPPGLSSRAPDRSATTGR